MRRKVKRFWLCRNNHPMIRTEGKRDWRCAECSYVNFARKTRDVSRCSYGHLKIKGIECRICKRYQRTPWMRELDEVGEALCPNGHQVSHHDESLRYSHGRLKTRCCRKCKELSIAAVHANLPDWNSYELCRNKRHPKIPENFYVDPKGRRECARCKDEKKWARLEREALQREKRNGLRPAHVDWVMVERLLSPLPLGHVRRGTHVGATDGERWVAYCTWQQQNPGTNPLDVIDHPHSDPVFMYRLSEWAKLGKKNGRRWKRVSLNEIRGMLDTQEYVKNKIL